MTDPSTPLGGRTEVVGALHVHTRHSDGTGDARTIAGAAAACGLDFVIINDHDTLNIREDGGEGWHGSRVLVAVGTEITASDGPHLLAHGNSSAAESCTFSSEEAFASVAAEGGRVYAAHPHGRGLFGLRRTLDRWDHWDHAGLTGLELWNYLQDWAASFRPWRPGSYLLHRVGSCIQGPPQWLLDLWDRQAARRHFPAICGSDNHAKKLLLAPGRFFPHETMLGRLVCRVRLERPLPADGSQAARELFAALAAGRSLVCREELASSRGFDFRVEAADGLIARPGEGPISTPLPAAGARALVESPCEAELSLVAGGKVVASAKGRRLEAALDGPGAVRAEARLDGRAWVFTNHVRTG